ncbi:MAG: hypothetical protein U5L06_06990 [Rhodovibrio sp.]|nr:hypothetical protein [Rhodovibrio sp.]
MSKKNRGPVFDRVDAGGGAARGRRAKRAGKTGAARTAAPEVAPTPTAPTDALFALALEPRLLLDAAAVATGADTIDDGADTGSAPTGGDASPDPKAAGDDLASAALADGASGAQADDIVFVDTGVEDGGPWPRASIRRPRSCWSGRTEDGMQRHAPTTAGRPHATSSRCTSLGHGSVGVVHARQRAPSNAASARQTTPASWTRSSARSRTARICCSTAATSARTAPGRRSSTRSPTATGADVAALVGCDLTGMRRSAATGTWKSPTGAIEADAHVVDAVEPAS